MRKLAERLLAGRQRLGISTELMAERLRAAGYDTTGTTVQSKERGLDASVDVFYLLAFCRVAGSDLTELLNFDTNEGGIGQPGEALHQ